MRRPRAATLRWCWPWCRAGLKRWNPKRGACSARRAYLARWLGSAGSPSCLADPCTRTKRAIGFQRWRRARQFPRRSESRSRVHRSTFLLRAGVRGRLRHAHRGRPPARPSPCWAMARECGRERRVASGRASRTRRSERARCAVVASGGRSALDASDFDAASERAQRGIACDAGGEQLGALLLVLAEAAALARGARLRRTRARHASRSCRAGLGGLLPCRRRELALLYQGGAPSRARTRAARELLGFAM